MTTIIKPHHFKIRANSIKRVSDFLNAVKENQNGFPLSINEISVMFGVNNMYKKFMIDLSVIKPYDNGKYDFLLKEIEPFHARQLLEKMNNYLEECKKNHRSIETCQQCGDSFIQKNIKQKYCSDICMNKAAIQRCSDKKLNDENELSDPLFVPFKEIDEPTVSTEVLQPDDNNDSVNHETTELTIEQMYELSGSASINVNFNDWIAKERRLYDVKIELEKIKNNFPFPQWMKARWKGKRKADEVSYENQPDFKLDPNTATAILKSQNYEARVATLLNIENFLNDLINNQNGFNKTIWELIYKHHISRNMRAALIHAKMLTMIDKIHYTTSFGSVTPEILSKAHESVFKYQQRLEIARRAVDTIKRKRRSVIVLPEPIDVQFPEDVIIQQPQKKQFLISVLWVKEKPSLCVLTCTTHIAYNYDEALGFVVNKYMDDYVKKAYRMHIIQSWEDDGINTEKQRIAVTTVWYKFGNITAESIPDNALVMETSFYNAKSHHEAIGLEISQKLNNKYSQGYFLYFQTTNEVNNQ